MLGRQSRSARWTVGGVRHPVAHAREPAACSMLSALRGVNLLGDVAALAPRCHRASRSVDDSDHPAFATMVAASPRVAGAGSMQDRVDQRSVRNDERPGLYGRPGHSETVVGTEADATSGAADAVENVERIHYKIQSPLSGSTSTPGGTASFRFRPVILGSHVSQAPQALSCK